MPLVPAPAPPAAVRAQFGRIAVVARSDTAVFRLQTPTSKTKAAKDAALGAGGGPLMFSAMSGAILVPPVALGALAWAPVGASLGGAYGAAAGESAGKIADATIKLHEAANLPRFEQSLRDTLAAAIPPHPATPPAASGPDDSPGVGQPASTPPSGDGVGTVLEVTISAPALAWTDSYNQPLGINPALEFRVDVQVRLVATSDNRELWSDRLLYRGQERRTFVGWAGPPAGVAPLRAELAHAAGIIGEEIAAQIFTRTAPGDAAAAAALAQRGLFRPLPPAVKIPPPRPTIAMKTITALGHGPN